jgi:hypothetical protein
MMITALFRRQEFFRCSFFVYNNYKDPKLSIDSEDIYIDQIMRSILVDKPRIRVNEIIWDYSNSVRMVPENLSRFIKDFKPKNLAAKIKKSSQAKKKTKKKSN